MTLTSKEEVFSWFQNLSGAKRIEMVCGLMSMCIPLEIRFFEAVIQDLSKKDFNTFREAEVKANSRQELELICKCDLLDEKTTPEYEGENEINGNIEGNSGALNTASNEPNQKALSKYPSRSKLIISLCLLQPTNHQCSSITFDSIRRQLMPENIMNQVYNVYIPKKYPLDGLFSEILLLLTMAMYHPAFSYEERDLLQTQKEEVEQVIALFYAQLRANALQQQSTASAIQPSPAQVPTTVTPIIGQQVGQPTYVNPNVLHQHNPSHTQPASQVHSYHQYGQHPQAPNSVVKSNQQHLVHLHQAPGTFSSHIQFIPNPMPIANLTYTPQQTPQTNSAQVTNQANLPNMSSLRLNSPPSISSASPSPTISPSTSVKVTLSVSNQQPIPNKLESLYTTANALPQMIILSETTGNSANTLQQGISFMNLTPTHPVTVDDVPKCSSSVSSSTSISSITSTSCYNCGSGGHRGTECTSGGEDSR